MLAGGTEVIVGSITDGSFGKLVAFGLGGVLVEVLKDITFRLAPATKEDALSMLDGIQAHEMLKGVRVEQLGYSDLVHELFPHGWHYADGHLHPGDAHGVGVEVDETLAARYPYEPAYLPVARLRDGSMTDW